MNTMTIMDAQIAYRAAQQRNGGDYRSALIKRTLMANKPRKAWLETREGKTTLIMLTHDNTKLERNI